MNESNDLAVFVYGTLKPGGHYWARYCEGRVVERQPARVWGSLYSLKVGYPAMVADEIPDETKASWVQGWRLVMRDEEALRGLDELEDFDPTRSSADNEYNRVRCACFTVEATAMNFVSAGEAWVYVMSRARVAELNGELIPSGEWVGVKKS